MLKAPILFLLLTAFLFSNSNVGYSAPRENDSIKIQKLNTFAYKTRLEAPQRTIRYGNLALKLAYRNNDANGIAESHRVIGIGNFYINRKDSAITHFMSSLNYFKQVKNLYGLAKVYNNIGNLYGEFDYEKGLFFYNEALKIAANLEMKELVAGCHLNIANMYHRIGQYDRAENHLKRSQQLFNEQQNNIGITQALQNRGVLALKQKRIDSAEKLLLEAHNRGLKGKLYNAISAINLTLTTIYINKGDFEKAEYYRDEGLKYAQITYDSKLEQDYSYTSFQLENRRRNYKSALSYLSHVYRTDSLNYNKEVSKIISLLEEQYKYREKEHERKLLVERQKSSERLNWAIGAVLLLSIIVIVMLVFFVRKQSKTNSQLTYLNDEISRKKESLDAINKHLEDIIEERTKDLQIKNRKLSEYSSHLSHQIRGPVAAMKGLILLEQDRLLDDEEFAREIATCVNDIDDKIISINQALHDPNKDSFNN